ncbi:MAG: phenylacetate--CoA ligase family protein [Thermoplasmatales archaeon]|nr:phenylacetate--CoA ligase family protein [Thermoplasmatales archaeon]
MRFLKKISYGRSVIGESFLLLRNFRTFHNTYKFLKKSQWWDKDKLKKYQFERLKKIIDNAYRHVPYYKDLFDKENIKPEEIKKFQYFEKIPFLTKKIIQENIEKLKADNIPSHKFVYCTTGGSTGEPLGFYLEKGSSFARQMAFSKIVMDRANCHFREKSVRILGHDTPMEYQLLRRKLVLSSFDFTEKNMSLFYEKIKQLKPRQIWSYPSAIVILANYINRKKLDVFPSLKAIFCLGEKLYDWQRDLLEKTFLCRIIGYYGNLEHTAFAATCEHSNYYHLFPEYSYVELIGENGETVKRDGEIGEIIATSFNNEIFPFIRYKTGDLGVFSSKECSCKRKHILLKNIEGRVQELAVTKDNQIVPITGTYGFAAYVSSHVKEIQLYQNKPGIININVVGDDSYTKHDSDKIINMFKERLRDQFEFNINLVDKIPRTESGKFRFFVQKMPVAFCRF